MQKQFRIVPTTLLGRIVFTLIALSLVVIGLFFLAFALIAAAIVATIVGIRLWWIRRKIQTTDSTVIEGTYSVDSERQLTVDPREPSGEDKNTPGR
jgi:uncharacterized membrane protein